MVTASPDMMYVVVVGASETPLLSRFALSNSIVGLLPDVFGESFRTPANIKLMSVFTGDGDTAHILTEYERDCAIKLLRHDGLEGLLAGTDVEELGGVAALSLIADKFEDASAVRLVVSLEPV